jgi:hypothetical protein
VAHVDSQSQDAFRRDLRLATQAVRSRVVPDRVASQNRHWKLWSTFCLQHRIDPTLQGSSTGFDAVPFLQVFAQRYRSGTIAPSCRPVRARTVEDAIRAIAQTLAAVGTPDPRLNSFGQIDVRLSSLWQSWKRTDPPPTRVKPIPVQVLRQLVDTTRHLADPMMSAVSDMIILAFFFLLRPGEYTGTSSNTTPFTLRDIQLFIASQRVNLLTCSDAILESTTFGTLEFTTQKNGVRGEVIGLGSTPAYFCPVKALQRRVLHLRRHSAPSTTPIASYFLAGRWHRISPSNITDALRATVASTCDSAQLGFLHSDVSARSLRAAGAMALLCAKVDTDIIRLMGRWRSDEMLRYLHVQAEPVMRGFAPLMLQAEFTLLPNHNVSITHVPMH